MSSKKKSKRIDRDFYPTPTWCAKGLISLLNINSSDTLLEPCIGSGRISDEFPCGNKMKWAELAVGVDYLNTDKDLSADVIITNPPFSLALEFIKTALTRDMNESGTVCMLLRLSILGSKDRADFWREFPFTNLIVITPRPSFAKGGTDNSEYAWVIWDYGKRLNAPALWNIKKDEIV